MVEKYKFKKISKISERDSKIILVGKILEKKENSFILEDDTGKIEIFYDGEIGENKFARVFCNLDEKLNAVIIHFIKEKEFYLFKKVNELYRKVEEYV